MRVLAIAISLLIATMAGGEPKEKDVLRRFGDGETSAPLPAFADGKFALGEGEVIVFVGGENLVREQKAGALESLLATGWAEQRPRFRSMAWEADTVYQQWRELNFGAWPAQLHTAEATIVVAQFGQIEALDGVGRLTEFKAAYHRLLDEFASRTQRVVLLSPMPFERPVAPHAPDLIKRNADVAAYAEAVREIAEVRGAVFVDLIKPLSARGGEVRLTGDGIHLTPVGLHLAAEEIARQLGVETSAGTVSDRLREAIVEKNRLWFDCWRPANWSFVYGDRIAQRFGQGSGDAPSLQQSFEDRLPLIEAGDARIHALAKGDPAPASTIEPVPDPRPSLVAKTPEEQMATFSVADGYEVELFASERDDVVKPIQFAWDERGRLWVACSPTYPQTEALTQPRDYVVVLEDTDGDGRADRSSRFAEGLTMLQGIELGHGGVYVCDFDRILFLHDFDGDLREDEREVLMSGFGIGDTHQLVNSITHGPDGSLWFTQGLHAMSKVETPWGIARLDRAGVWRLRPRTLRLEGFFGGGMAGANCWGVAFDDYNQVFHKTGDRPQGYWTVPGMVRGASPLGSGSESVASQSYAKTPQQYHGVGNLFDTSPKTTSLEIIGTSALPDEVQGAAVIAGYMGGVVEMHELHDHGAGFRSTQLPKLLRSEDRACRPVDVSVGPDGAIYVADWYNPVIGHYQASYADPARDKISGRIWRISAKERPRVEQPDLAAMDEAALIEQLRSPERWTRAQARRLLFGRDSDVVLEAVDAWLKVHFSAAEDRLLLDVAGVVRAHEAARPGLLDRLLASKDPRVVAYAMRLAGEWSDAFADPLARLKRGVASDHPRVRLEAVVATTYVPRAESVVVATGALSKPMDPFLTYALHQAARASQPLWERPLAAGELAVSDSGREYLQELAASEPKVASPGEQLYAQACIACHQPGGEGLPGVYPPLEKSDWVSGDPERLIKVVLHGLSGPIEVNGKPFVSSLPVPMPPFAGLSDEQISTLLTFLRSNFGNEARPITAAAVEKVRAR